MKGNKKCPYLGDIGWNVSGIRMGWEAELTSVDKRVVDICLNCPLAVCIFDKKKITPAQYSSRL